MTKRGGTIELAKVDVDANKRLAAAAESGTGIEEAVSSWRQISLVDIAVLLVVVWSMVTKLGV